MFKLIIAEDEALAREAIERSIDFAAYDFELVASCEDGREAWDAYRRWQPDLVLADINMPNMSGLELAKAIREDGRECRVVIITGYDRFDYAREAISYQVADYLLKPVTPQELRDILSKNRDILATRASHKAQLQAQISQSYRTESLARNQLLNRFISSGLDEASLEAAPAELASVFSQPHYLLALLEHDLRSGRAEKMQLSAHQIQFLLQNLASELADNLAELTVFPAFDEPIVILAGGSDTKILEKLLQDFIQQLAQTFRELTTLHFRAGYSLSAVAAGLPRARSQADLALEFALNSPSHVVVGYGEMRRLTREGLEYSRGRLLESCLKQQEETLPAAVSDYVNALRFARFSPEEARTDCAELADQLREKGCFLPEAGGGLLRLFEQVGGDPIPLRDQLLEWLRAGLEQSRQGQSGSTRDLALSARHYIDKHYADSELSLISLCARLNVSMSYFSSVFKNETGQTFVEYLTGARIRNAKKLLTESNLMLYAIAERVGFESAAYFTATFKKNTGYTPKEYRRHFTLGEER